MTTVLTASTPSVFISKWNILNKHIFIEAIYFQVNHVCHSLLLWLQVVPAEVKRTLLTSAHACKTDSHFPPCQRGVITSELSTPGAALDWQNNLEVLSTHRDCEGIRDWSFLWSLTNTTLFCLFSVKVCFASIFCSAVLVAVKSPVTVMMYKEQHQIH